MLTGSWGRNTFSTPPIRVRRTELEQRGSEPRPSVERQTLFLNKKYVHGGTLWLVYVYLLDIDHVGLCMYMLYM